jgi:hypothetical protein
MEDVVHNLQGIPALVSGGSGEQTGGAKCNAEINLIWMHHDVREHAST